MYNKEYFQQKITQLNNQIEKLNEEIIEKKELNNFIKIFNATLLTLGLCLLPISAVLVRIYWHSITFYIILYAYLIGAIPLSLISIIMANKNNKKIKKLNRELSINKKTKQSYINELQNIEQIISRNISRKKENSKYNFEIKKEEYINKTYEIENKEIKQSKVRTKKL